MAATIEIAGFFKFNPVARACCAGEAWDCWLRMSLSHRFEVERMKRTIDTANEADLRTIARLLLDAWNAQHEAVESMAKAGWLPQH